MKRSSCFDDYEVLLADHLWWDFGIGGVLGQWGFDTGLPVDS